MTVPPEEPPKTTANGSSPASKSLVDYPDDDEDDAMDTKDDKTKAPDTPPDSSPPQPTPPSSHTGESPTLPPERLSEKRRREEDEEDELGKLSQHKRRSASVSSREKETSPSHTVLRRKKSFHAGSVASRDASGTPGARKIAISLAVKSTGEEGGRDEGG